MRVLIVYSSKRGGTEGLAAMLGDALATDGLDVRVRDAGTLVSAGDIDLGEFDGVIVGGALYAMRWPRPARRFVRRNAPLLRALPVWMFSSGPLGGSARHKEIPPVGQVRRLMDLVGARGHVTFGGRLAPDARGFPAAAMAKKNAGDWRDPDHVAEFAHRIATDLAVARHRP